jgi:hypothetical protein
MKTLVVTALAALSSAACMMQQGFGAECDATPIDPYRELIVVDDAVLSPSSANDRELAWSPDALFASAAPSATDGPAWLERGIVRWTEAAEADGRPEVAATLRERVVPALSAVPFRTLAVVNRIDLGALPDARSRAGEGRVVLGFAAPTDPGTPEVALTLIFEFALAGRRAEWAERWHALGAAPRGQFGAALEDLVERFVLAPPLADGARALSQVRASLIVDGTTSELRELALDGRGELVVRELRNTPRPELDGTGELTRVVTAQAGAVRTGTHTLPLSMRTTSQTHGAHDWTLPGIDAKTRKAFDEGTCAGCHAKGGIDGGFHVSPFGEGRARLSRFLHDPAADDDELRRRERELEATLCGQ